MTCIAKLVTKYSDDKREWSMKTWVLYDGDRAFGEMVFNSAWAYPYQVHFYSPLGAEFGGNGFKSFPTHEHALVYAREGKDQNLTYTKEMVEERLRLVLEDRAREEMSNDWFYTQRRDRFYDQRIAKLNQLLANVEQ